MFNEKNIIIEQNSSNVNEYIIKDRLGINLGRVFILDMENANKQCTMRIKFYKGNQYEALKEALVLILRTIFNNGKILKINIIVNETINTRVFTECGFILQGILENNTIINGMVKDELIFGVNYDDFRNQNSINLFSIKGNRIQLKLLTPENSEEVLDYYLRNRTHLKKFEPLRDESFYTLETQKSILMEVYLQYLNGTSLNLGIYKDNRLIGKVQVSNIVHGIFKNAFIGYSIDKDEQGKGYMKEAVAMAVDYVFNDMELHRIEASTLIDNVRSQRVLKACGFKELGINKNYLYINGSWKDHITFYKIKEF